ncbi:MAG: hypothetical protein H7245_24265 [Candidatus Saccharibacteria bacterium]|nr:hypothetical protein [Pseudorhodobacter sp.]
MTLLHVIAGATSQRRPVQAARFRPPGSGRPVQAARFRPPGSGRVVQAA